jgi:hypothetical protein
MMNLRIAVVMITLGPFLGCSTVPIQPPKVAGPAIVFVRDTGFLGSGCTLDVLVDGDVVGQVKAGETVTKLVSSGKHRVGIANATVFCPNVKMSKVVEVTGEPVVLRIGIMSNTQAIFDQIE